MALTLSELARLVDGDIVRGGPDLLIEGIAALDEAGGSELSFLGNEKYRAQFLATRAAAVIVPRGVTEGPETSALIAAENPSYAFGLAVKHFVAATARVFTPGVHPRAIVDESAKLDATKVRIHAGAAFRHIGNPPAPELIGVGGVYNQTTITRQKRTGVLRARAGCSPLARRRELSAQFQ